MDRTITVQRLGEVQDEFGGVSERWTTIGATRAQLVQSSTEEFIEGGGEQAARVAVFRVRWFSGLKNADRVLFEDGVFDLLEVKEIGRRRGLELRCKAAAS